jgi:hypothetical protein
LKKKLAFFGLVFLVLACNTLKDGAPPDLIPSNEMASILYEVHKTETMASRMSFKTFDSSKVAYDYMESKILENYKVDTAQYRKSYEYYASNPDQFAIIYDLIEKMLEKEKDEE